MAASHCLRSNFPHGIVSGSTPISTLYLSPQLTQSISHAHVSGFPLALSMVSSRQLRGRELNASLCAESYQAIMERPVIAGFSFLQFQGDFGKFWKGFLLVFQGGVDLLVEIEVDGLLLVVILYVLISACLLDVPARYIPARLIGDDDVIVAAALIEWGERNGYVRVESGAQLRQALPQSIHSSAPKLA